MSKFIENKVSTALHTWIFKGVSDSNFQWSGQVKFAKFLLSTNHGGASWVTKIMEWIINDWPLHQSLFWPLRPFTKIKVKCLEKLGSAWCIYKKRKLSSTYELFEYNFMQNRLESSNKIDLTIQMIFNHEKHHTICLKFGDRLITSLTMLALQAKTIICFINKEKLLL